MDGHADSGDAVSRYTDPATLGVYTVVLVALVLGRDAYDEVVVHVTAKHGGHARERACAALPGYRVVTHFLGAQPPADCVRLVRL